MWPNLPAPVGEGPILITSAGQAVDGQIVSLMAKRLHLEADYRPRALATDLYAYNTIIFTVGYSPTGVHETFRTLEDETIRLKRMVIYALEQDIPIIILHLGGSTREDVYTYELFKELAPYSEYFIGLRSMNPEGDFIKLIKQEHVPITLVKNLNQMLTPLNSAFR